jgi:hypothetical protein
MSKCRWFTVLLIGLLAAGCGGPPSSVLSGTPGTDTGGLTGTTGSSETTAGTDGSDAGDSGSAPTGGSGGTGGTGDPAAPGAATGAGATLAASLRTPAEIVADLTAIGDLQRHSNETKEQQVASALRRVRAYRSLIGLRTDVSVDAAYTELAEAAAEICMRLGTLTHTPSRPPGMSDAQYDLASQGAGECNLASGFPSITIPQSIDFYMDDSDSGNIDRVGHRRWIMSPLLTHTGFGLSSDRQFTAMHVFPDAAYAAACFSDLDAVQPWDMLLYPRWGHMPIEYFAAADVAWSISLRGDRYRAEGVSAASISVRPAGADNTPTGPALNISYFARSTGNFGCQQPVLIFRPDGINLAAGQRYRAIVTGITDMSGAPVTLDYWVEFFVAGVTVNP